MSGQKAGRGNPLSAGAERECGNPECGYLMMRGGVCTKCGWADNEHDDRFPQVDCPNCDRTWPEGCEQAVAIELYDACISCTYFNLAEERLAEIQKRAHD